MSYVREPQMRTAILVPRFSAECGRKLRQSNASRAPTCLPKPESRFLEVRCLGFDHQTFSLDVIRRPKTTPIHELERYVRCRDCSRVRGYAFKRSHLVALRQRKVSASDPPSRWWPGERWAFIIAAPAFGP